MFLSLIATVTAISAQGCDVPTQPVQYSSADRSISEVPREWDHPYFRPITQPWPCQQEQSYNSRKDAEQSLIPMQLQQTEEIKNSCKQRCKIEKCGGSETPRCEPKRQRCLQILATQPKHRHEDRSRHRPCRIQNGSTGVSVEKACAISFPRMSRQQQIASFNAQPYYPQHTLILFAIVLHLIVNRSLNSAQAACRQKHTMRAARKVARRRYRMLTRRVKRKQSAAKRNNDDVRKWHCTNQHWWS